MLNAMTAILAVPGAVAVAKAGYNLYYADWSKIKRLIEKDAFRTLRKLPFIGPKVNQQIEKDLNPMLDSIAEDIAKQRDLNTPYATLNHDPIDQETLLAELDKLKDKFDENSLYKVSGSVYCAQDNEELNALMNAIADKSRYTNPLHPDVWPKLQQMAAQVVNSCFDMFKAPEPQKGFGYITPGGTFSLIEACKTYYNKFYEQKTGIERLTAFAFNRVPEIIVPDTAHAGFEKGANLLGAKLIKVPVDPVTRRADIKAMEKQITHNTIMIAGSAPSYPTGTMDDIEALGQLAIKYNVGLHVDACLGGFVVPFMQKTPYKFGFDVPGVSSISVDTHKEGGADKGSSVILYKSREELGQYQMSTHMDWSGGLYATPGLGGSASGYAIASAWAMMHHKALTGYQKDARDIHKIVQDIKSTVDKMRDLSIMGQPDANVIAFTSKTINPHIVADRMHEKGWVLNVLPDGFHFCVTGVHINHRRFAQEFMGDLKESVTYVARNKALKPKGNGAIYGATKALPAVMTPLKEQMAKDYLGLQWKVVEPKPAPEQDRKLQKTI